METSNNQFDKKWRQDFEAKYKDNYNYVCLDKVVFIKNDSFNS